MNRAPLTAGFLDTPPLTAARRAAQEFGCDLAIGNQLGIGSLVCLTPVAAALARRLGRPVRLLSGPYDAWDNLAQGGSPYPLWEHNPYVGEIVDGESLDADLMWAVSREAHNFPQPGHMVDNHLALYGLRRPPGAALRGELHISAEEGRAALQRLAHLPRPLVCLCPYGRSAPGPESPWYVERWLELIDTLRGKVGFFAVGGGDQAKPLPVEQPATTLRELFALIWAADAYVGFDTGPSHAAAALGVPSVVLWDAVRKTGLEEAKQPGFAPAMLNRWAYPQNRNLMILGERNREVSREIIAFLAANLATPTFS
jgi:hypothetical protein